MVRNYKRKKKGPDSVAMQAVYEGVKKNVSLKSGTNENGADRMTLTGMITRLLPPIR